MDTGDFYDRRDGYTASGQTMQQKKEKKLKTAQLIALLCKFPCASDVVVPTLDGELSQYLKLEEHNGQIWLMATTPEQSDNVIFNGDKDNDSCQGHKCP